MDEFFVNGDTITYRYNVTLTTTNATNSQWPMPAEVLSEPMDSDAAIAEVERILGLTEEPS